MLISIQMEIDSNRFARVAPLITQELRQVNIRTAKRIVRTIHRKMKEPKTGRIYHRPGTVRSFGTKKGQVSFRIGRSHRASAKGQAPAIDSRTLYKGVQVAEIDNETVAVEILPEYGLYLELGTVHMKDRPYLDPSILENVKAWRADILEAVKLGIKREAALVKKEPGDDKDDYSVEED